MTKQDEFKIKMAALLKEYGVHMEVHATKIQFKDANYGMPEGVWIKVDWFAQCTDFE